MTAQGKRRMCKFAGKRGGGWRCGEERETRGTRQRGRTREKMRRARARARIRRASFPRWRNAMLVSSSPLRDCGGRSAGISEKYRWIHLYSAGRISRDYLRIAELDERDFHSPKIYPGLSPVDLFLQAPGDRRYSRVFPIQPLAEFVFRSGDFDFILFPFARILSH